MAEYIERQKVFDSLPTVVEDKTITLYGAVADFMVLVSAIPTADVVPRGAYDQVAWERDIAIQQLREDYGVGLGEKKSADVVELPCKVGDVVWAYLRGWRHEDGVAPYKITNLTITQNKKGKWTKKYRAMWLVDGNTRDWVHDFSFDEIGKTTFLSKEEAERMLCGADMRGDD